MRIAGHEVPLPAWRPLRVGLGIAFLFGGVFWMLPVLGLWMVPVGVLILSVDLPPVRRARRRFDTWFGRSRLRQALRRMRRGKKKGPSG